MLLVFSKKWRSRIVHILRGFHDNSGISYSNCLNICNFFPPNYLLNETYITNWVSSMADLFFASLTSQLGKRSEGSEWIYPEWFLIRRHLVLSMPKNYEDHSVTMSTHRHCLTLRWFCLSVGSYRPKTHRPTKHRQLIFWKLSRSWLKVTFAI